jgi:hypothetical protein
MAKFMLLLESPPGQWRDLSAEEIQRKVERYQAWADRVRTSGRYLSSEKLAEEGGKVLERRQGRLTVVDGPYAEAKEVVGGYFLFRAASFDEAIDLVRDCPFLEDYRLAIRQTDPTGCGGD